MVIDGSVWIEILRDGPLKQKCQRTMAGKPIRIPALVIFEVYKKIKSKISEEAALEVVAHLNSYQVLDLTYEIAILVGDLSIEHELPMADSLVLAHAEVLSDQIMTLDNDFAEIPNAVIIRT